MGQTHTHSPGAYSKWPPRIKSRKVKNRIFHISISNYHKYTKFISKYLFLRVTNMIEIFKIWFLITKELKIHYGWPQNHSWYRINQCAIFSNALTLSKTVLNTPENMTEKQFWMLTYLIITIHYVNSENLGIIGLLWSFPNSGHGICQQDKIRHFHSWALICHRFTISTSEYMFLTVGNLQNWWKIAYSEIKVAKSKMASNYGLW